MIESEGSTGGHEPQPPLSPEQANADAADLDSSLRELAGLVTGTLGLTELLGNVATFAARAIPGADGAGVTLLRTDQSANRVEAIAASHPFVAEIDEIQYVTLNEGPCITAALEGRTSGLDRWAAKRCGPDSAPG